jgi:hypothetical protein
MTVGYYRNWYSDFTSNNNLQVTPVDYTSFCLNAPVDSRLPGGGGQLICDLADVSPAKASAQRTQVTKASEFGNAQRYSDFFGITFNARLARGVRLAGGYDAGPTINDTCFVIDSPEQAFRGIEPTTTGATTSAGMQCRAVTRFRGTQQFKMNGSVPLWYGFQVSGTLQNLPARRFWPTISSRTP